MFVKKEVVKVKVNGESVIRGARWMIEKRRFGPRTITGGGFCSRVGTLEGGLEIFDEVREGPKGEGIQGCLGANCSPAFGCSFCHEGEGISDLLVVGRINVFVYEEVGSD